MPAEATALSCTEAEVSAANNALLVHIWDNRKKLGLSDVAAEERALKIRVLSNYGILAAGVRTDRVLLTAHGLVYADMPRYHNGFMERPSRRARLAPHPLCGLPKEIYLMVKAFHAGTQFEVVD